MQRQRRAAGNPVQRAAVTTPRSELANQRYGGYRSQFYRYFPNKDDCFAAAYEAEVDRICDQLLASISGEGSKVGRVEAALAAGGAALDKRRNFVERLSQALDRGCRETTSRHSPPPTTLEFIIGMVEQALSLSTSLVNDAPEEFSAAIPELARIIADFHGEADTDGPGAS
jgi:AcrR family transcriptional regulator